MTTAIGAGASLMIRVGALMCVAFGILLLISAAAMAQDVVAVTPTGPAPVPDVPTVTLVLQGVAAAFLVVLLAVIVWRASMLDLWMHSRLDLHGMAAALMEDEMRKRGLVVDRAVPPAAPEPTLEPIEDPWAAEADKVAPPPPPMPAPRRVQSTKSAKAMASDLSPFTARKKGSVMQ